MRFQKSSLQCVFYHPNTWFFWRKKKSKYVFFPWVSGDEVRLNWTEWINHWALVKSPSFFSQKLFNVSNVLSHGWNLFHFPSLPPTLHLGRLEQPVVILAFPSLQAARAVNLCFSVAGALILTGRGCFWRSLLCVAPLYSQTAHFCACPHPPPPVSVELFLESFSRCSSAH